MTYTKVPLEEEGGNPHSSRGVAWRRCVSVVLWVITALLIGFAIATGIVMQQEQCDSMVFGLVLAQVIGFVGLVAVFSVYVTCVTWHGTFEDVVAGIERLSKHDSCSKLALVIGPFLVLIGNAIFFGISEPCHAKTQLMEWLWVGVEAGIPLVICLCACCVCACYGCCTRPHH